MRMIAAYLIFLLVGLAVAALIFRYRRIQRRRRRTQSFTYVVDNERRTARDSEPG